MHTRPKSSRPLFGSTTSSSSTPTVENHEEKTSPFLHTTRTTTALLRNTLQTSPAIPSSSLPLFARFAAPNFSYLDPAANEFEFPALTAMDFNNGNQNEVHIPWFASARNHVYSIEQIDQFLERVNQRNNEFMRFVLAVDMSIWIGAEGIPDENTPAHGQMTQQRNAFSLTSGLVEKRVEDGVLIIAGADNGSSYFMTAFQTLQFFFIKLLKTKAYQEGKIKFAEQLRLINITGSERRVYQVSSARLIARCEALAELYKDTLLSPENLIEYAQRFQPAISHEEPEGVTKYQFDRRIEQPAVTEPTQTTKIRDMTPEQMLAFAKASSPSKGKQPPGAPKKVPPAPEKRKSRSFENTFEGHDIGLLSRQNSTGLSSRFTFSGSASLEPVQRMFNPFIPVSARTLLADSTNKTPENSPEKQTQQRSPLRPFNVATKTGASTDSNNAPENSPEKKRLRM